MGGFVDFHCKQCRYEETDIGVGSGKNPSPVLALFRCTRCKTVGSTWAHAGRTVRCANCYEDNVPLLPDDIRIVECPRCGEQADFTPKDGSWE